MLSVSIHAGKVARDSSIAGCTAGADRLCVLLAQCIEGQAQQSPGRLRQGRSAGRWTVVDHASGLRARCRSRSRDAGADLLEFNDQFVDFGEELLATRVRRLRDQVRRVLGQCLLPGHARPAPDFAVGQQGKSTQVRAAACVSQVAQQIVEPELERNGRCNHVAVQH